MRKRAIRELASQVLNTSKIRDALGSRYRLLRDDDFYAEYSAESLAQRRFYNVGAAGFSKRYWTSIDYLSDQYRKQQRSSVDIHFDLNSDDQFPLPSGLAEVFYSTQVIEHLPNDAVARFFSEAYRCLRPGGVLRIVCPNADVISEAYCNGDRLFFAKNIDRYSEKGRFERQFSKPYGDATVGEMFLNAIASETSALREVGDNKFNDSELRRIMEEKPYESALDYITSFCRYRYEWPQLHINWWNPQKVVRFMKESGFKDVQVRQCAQGKCLPLREVEKRDSRYLYHNLYVEAVKGE